MTRPLLALAAVLVAATAATPLMAKPRAYEDNKLNFKDCKGENVTARWFKTQLTISVAGKSPEEPADSIELKDWDGNCVTLRWDFDAAHFVTTHGDASTTGQVISYVAWDETLWAASRTYSGFYHARVAEKGDPDPRSKIKAVGEWLAKNNTLEVPAADVLAEELTSGRVSSN